MRPLAAVSLAATAVLTVACQSDRSLRPPIGSPSAAISDALHGDDGNKGFFFKPPMVPDPSADFTAGKFNESVSPVVLICEGTDITGTSCVSTEIAQFTMTTGPGSETVRLSLTDEHYIVNWHTDEFPLDPALTYRINVFVGTNRLGFADIELGANKGELKNVNTQEFVPLVDGRTLPIKFRIEDSALCGPPWTQFCNSETIVLTDGGTVVLEGTGDRVDIPPQPDAGDRVITVTVTLCDGIDVDLPRFGNCLTVTADPPLGDFEFNPPAVVSMCSITTDGVPLPAAPQDDLITMYRQDNGTIVALPHAEDFCVEPIGRTSPSLWQQFARALGKLLAPRPLHANMVVLDVGEAGETNTFSDFQLVLSAQLNADNDNESAEHPTDLGTHAPGTSVTATVVVTDELGAPVANATVRFTHAPPTGGTDGGVLGPSPQCATVGIEHVCTSGADGRVAVTWTLSSTAGLNQLAAKTIGAGLHADLDGTGPFDSCVPEIVDVEHVHCTGTETVPVDLTEGIVTFTATGGEPDLVISSGEPTVTPTLVLPGGNFTLSTWTIENQGNGAVPSGINVNVAYFLSPDAVITTSDVFRGSSFVTGAGMIPGQQVQGPSLVFTIPSTTAPGDYWFGILADQDDAVAESDETNNFVSTPLRVASSLLVRPSSDGVTAHSSVTLPLTERSGLSMQDNTGIQLEVSPSTEVTWSSSDATGATASVNETGLLAVVQGNDDPSIPNEVIITATGASAIGSIKVNSFNFNHFPRYTTVVWRPISGAATYDVQVQFFDPGDETWKNHVTGTTSNLRFAFQFVGAQPGRWRVVGRDSSGAEISSSEFVYFRYTI